MLSSARRRPALLVGLAAAWAVALALLAGAGRSQAQSSPQPPVAPLLALARGQLLASLGTPPQWLPESGVPTTLTLFAGPRSDAGLANNAYIALQRASRRCARSAAGDHATLITLTTPFVSANLILHERGSPWAGAPKDVYALTVGPLTLHEARAVRVCVWLAPTPRARALALSQSIPLLNGLFAASVSTLANPSGGAYTLDAIDVGRVFSYSIATLNCGDHYADTSGPVSDGQLATDSIAIGTNPCAGDGSIYTFTAANGSEIGTLGFSITQAVSPQPVVAAIGGCELDPIAGTPVNIAEGYVEAVGCRVKQLIVGPYSTSLPRGSVVEAQVTGGLAEVAPRGAAVDLEINGTPPLISSRR
jgi:hypothetical protein